MITCLLLFVSCVFSTTNTSLMTAGIFICPMPHIYFYVNKQMKNKRTPLKKIVLIVNMDFRDKQLLCPSKLTNHHSRRRTFNASTNVPSLTFLFSAGDFSVTWAASWSWCKCDLNTFWYVKLCALIKEHLEVGFCITLLVADCSYPCHGHIEQNINSFSQSLGGNTVVCVFCSFFTSCDTFLPHIFLFSCLSYLGNLAI